MRILSLIFSLILGIGPTFAARENEETLEVLFIGNSYTARHNLAQVVKSMAEKGNPGLTFKVSSVIYGGRRLVDHWRLGTQNVVKQHTLTADEVKATIAGLEKEIAGTPKDGYAKSGLARQRKLLANLESSRSEWDVIVLQSYRDDLDGEKSLYAEYAPKFAELAKAQGARVILYETTPSTQNAEALTTPPDPEPVMKKAREIAALADRIDASVAPMSLVGLRCQTERPDLALRFINDAHLNQTMAYLSACSIYAALFDRSPVGLPIDSITDTRYFKNQEKDKDRDGKPITRKFSEKDRADLQRITWESYTEFQSLREKKADGPNTGEPKCYAFFITGDPQYLAEKSETPTKLDPWSEQANSRFLERIQALPGTRIPKELGGGDVSKDILGVIVSGDLIDSCDKNGGNYPAMQRFEWERYVADYGLTGTEGKIPWPVYELHGNHDGPQGDTFVIDAIIERNRTRTGVAHRSTNGLHYSWDWGPLHGIALGMFAGEGESRREDHHYAARSSLEFLRADLESQVGDSGRPILITFHLHPNCPEFDWPAEDLSAFWNTIQNHNVIALVHGHTHGSPPSRMKWDGKEFGTRLLAGIDVFNPDDSGASKEDPRNPGKGVGLAHGLLYAELIDAPGEKDDRFIVRSYFSRDNWETHQWDKIWEKPVTLGRAPDQASR